MNHFTLVETKELDRRMVKSSAQSLTGADLSEPVRAKPQLLKVNDNGRVEVTRADIKTNRYCFPFLTYNRGCRHLV